MRLYEFYFSSAFYFKTLFFISHFTKILICGYKEFKQLDLNSNNKNSQGKSIINPPIQYHADPTLLSSFSTNYNQTVWISKKGESYVTGNNSEYKISGLLPKKVLTEDTKFTLNNQLNQPYKFISSVCGSYYTLYLVTDDIDDTNFQLIYCYENRVPNPLFLNIGNRKPLALFGGYYTSAVIDTEGGIIIITQSVLETPTKQIEPSFLPNSDKAIKIAFGYTFVMALGQSGKIYQTKVDKTSPIKFEEIEDFVGQIGVDISGTYDFSFVVLHDGRVFGIGSNWHCKLGLPEKVRSVSKFTEIDSLKNYKIISAFNGSCHSIFLTSNRKMIVRGYNGNGQLFLKPKEIVFPPEEVDFCNGVTFCIAADLSSVAFVGIDPPKNVPNRKLNEVDESNIKKEMIDPKDEEIFKLQKENSELKFLLIDYKKRIEKLEKENFELKMTHCSQNNNNNIELDKIDSYNKTKRMSLHEISPPIVVCTSNDSNNEESAAEIGI